jgi:probable addiction module antidote protein
MEPPEQSDSAAYFGTEDDILDYLNAWLEDGSAAEIARALGDVARVKGIVEVRTGAGRRPLYAALSEDGNPSLDLVTAVLAALDLRLSVEKTAA